MNEPEKDNEDLAQSRPTLVAGLSALYNRPVPVPPDVDEAILAAARRHLRSGRTRIISFPFPRWLSAAAAIAAVLLVSGLWLSKHRTPAVVAREDIDRNGRIDILDAFALARRIDSGAARAQQFDINGDGVVDRRDIDALAAQAVKLEPRKG